MDEPRPSFRLVRELYFPTFIYFGEPPGAEKLNAELRPLLYAWRDSDPQGLMRSNARHLGSWHSPDDMHQRPEYQELARHVLDAGQHIFGELGYAPSREPFIENMWANLCPRHGYNRLHCHPEALWSGVYYVQTPAGSGRLIFDDPRPQALMLPPRYSEAGAQKPESWGEVYFQPIAGRLLLFPAWLRHSVEPNASEDDGPAGDRISVSFNLNQRR